MESERTKIPIRIKSQELNESSRANASVPVEEALPPVVESGCPAMPPACTENEELEELEEELEMWRDRALRLEAEMDNFRKRQRRLTEDRVAADQERLLRAFLGVADDLARALSTDGADAASLRQGVDLTYKNMMQLLVREGVRPLEAEGERFDPAWHEAMGTIPHEEASTEPDRVAEVVQLGYRLGDRLLRPARVIVAT
ncbi:MAG: nucleotide exchange factor GrpE [Anaerolineae bacterium]